MMKSLQFRFILISMALLLSIASLAWKQYDLSKHLQSLHEAQLVLKELNIQFLKMKTSEVTFFMHHNASQAKEVEGYGNTMDIYLSIVDDYLDEFTYTEDFENAIEEYLIYFSQLSKHPSMTSEQHHKLDDKSTYIETFISQEEERLTPLISAKIDNIRIFANLAYLVFFILLISLLYMLVRPMQRIVFIFTNFFIQYKDSSMRLDEKLLYFTEVKTVAKSLNKMLSKQENIEGELSSARDEAIQLQKARDEFLSNMSHELRTPLNAIGGFSNILLKKIPSEKKTITPIIESSGHLLSLVNDILDLSKIQSGKFSIIEESFDLSAELTQIEKTFQSQMKNKGIDFSITKRFNENLYLIGDWFRILQILNNFLSNALKFTSEKGEVRLNVLYENETLLLEVHDNGIGISTEAQSRILEPFEQSDLSTTKQYGGTGLGLSIAVSICKLMKGEFIIRSEEAKGSTFAVRIPLKQDTQIKTSTHLENQLEVALSFDAFVLIAEDNKTNQLLISMLLDDVGIRYEIANDGKEATELFEEGKYDLILMDENMPNMNGIDAMLYLRKNYKNVPPIIAVTANAMIGDQKRLLDAGMDNFVSKPIANEKLLEVLSLYLKTK